MRGEGVDDVAHPAGGGELDEPLQREEPTWMRGRLELRSAPALVRGGIVLAGGCTWKVKVVVAI